MAGESLSPRQELLPAPEALMLRPGADISGEPAAWVESVVDGSLTVTGSKSGYVVDVCLNDGPEPLETGYVVAVVGVSDPVMGEIPVMRVAKATAVNAGAVVGVVDQRFIIDAEKGESLAHPDTAVPSLAANTAVQTGRRPIPATPCVPQKQRREPL